MGMSRPRASVCHTSCAQHHSRLHRTANGGFTHTRTASVNAMLKLDLRTFVGCLGDLKSKQLDKGKDPCVPDTEQ